MRTIKESDWRELYSLDDSDIDHDHFKLFKIYNDLVGIINNNGSRKEFATVLIDMHDYSLSHFKREEHYMTKLAYPKIKQHKAYHRVYLYKVSIYNSELLSSNPPTKEEVADFLKKWWIHHIAKNDLDYIKYKNSIDSEVNY